MTLLDIIAMGIALSLDAFAVALTIGVCTYCSRSSQRGRFVVVVGLSHTLMVLAGWVLWSLLHRVVDTYDHWVASLLLLLLGAKMIYETVKGDSSDGELINLNIRNTLFLSVVLSIDAIVSGFSLGIVPIKIAEATPTAAITIAAVIIGILASAISALGMVVGNAIGRAIGSKAGIVGGVVLIILAAKILFEA